MDDIYDKLVDLQICPRDIWSDMRDEVRSMCDKIYSASDPDLILANRFWGEYSMSNSCQHA